MVIGKITTIEYDRFRARLLHSVKSASTSIQGRVYHIGNIGSYVKIKNHINDDIICEVTAIQEAERETKTKVDAQFDLDSVRELILRPIGILTHQAEGKGSFSLGVSIYPSIYSDVHVVTREDLNCILTDKEQDNAEPGKKQDNAKPARESIVLGTSKSLIDYHVSVDIDKFFNIHTAVLGNSGSGKSYTIAHILQSVLKKPAPGAKFILFDTNGEYPKALTSEEGKYYKPGTSGTEPSGATKFILPYYLLNLEEWLAFLMASDRTQRPFWAKVLQLCYRFYRLGDKSKAEDFANYIKWKVYKMLNILAARGGGDTGNMTDAISILSHIQSVVISPNLRTALRSLKKDLTTFCEQCMKICTFHYASNEGMLIQSLPEFLKNKSTRYVTTRKEVIKNNAYYTAEILSKKAKDAFKQIEEQKAEKVEQENLDYGQYFDIKFLKIAAELVLMEEEAKGNTRIREFTSTMFTRLDFLITNQECAFMREAEGVPKTADAYWEEYIGGADAQLITIDLSELGDDILELVTSVISRMVFDRRKGLDAEKRKKKPIHLILDEAHRYIKRDKDYILRENIFERIAREGRKFAYYLLVSSQRPSELSPVVLSQCANYIIHRIHNRVDLDFVSAVLPYFSDDYVTKIKQAIPGEALVFGNCVPMPLRVQLQKADPEPASENCKVWEEWKPQKQGGNSMP